MSDQIPLLPFNILFPVSSLNHGPDVAIVRPWCLRHRLESRRTRHHISWIFPSFEHMKPQSPAHWGGYCERFVRSIYSQIGRPFVYENLSAILEAPCLVEHAHALLPNGFLVAVAFAFPSGHALDWVVLVNGFRIAGGHRGETLCVGRRIHLYIYLSGILYRSEDSIFLGFNVVYAAMTASHLSSESVLVPRPLQCPPAGTFELASTLHVRYRNIHKP